MHLPQFRERVDSGLIREAALAAEEAGLDDIWVSDHVLIPAGSERPPTAFHDALTVLTYAAAHTRRVGLGTSVLVAPYRDPVVLARTVASLDALSSGRVLLGLASGWLREEFAAVGVRFGERGARTDEAIGVLRALFRGDPSFQGRFTNFADMSLQPGPARPGGPPIWIGGNSNAGIERAARLGDAWHTTISDPARLEPKIERLRAAAANARREPADVRVSVRVRARAPAVADLATGLVALGVEHLLVDLEGTDPARFAEDAPRLRAAADAA
jgi:probable F420-dependent oxidoreductase